jgi:MarR family transcriptional regulator, organic hydroperoxide resistance regulator
MSTIDGYTVAVDEKSSAVQKEIKQPRPFISRAQEATVGILRTADVLRSRFAALIEPHSVTVQQHNVLRILRGVHPQPLPTLEIGERLIERMPGITRLLDRLEAKGLVRRERSGEDRRLVHCWITEEGLELLAGLDTAVDRLDEAIADELSPAEIGSLIDMLDRVRSQG